MKKFTLIAALLTASSATAGEFKASPDQVSALTVVLDIEDPVYSDGVLYVSDRYDKAVKDALSSDGLFEDAAAAIAERKAEWARAEADRLKQILNLKDD